MPGRAAGCVDRAGLGRYFPLLEGRSSGAVERAFLWDAFHEP
jgi:hypothetical protein